MIINVIQIKDPYETILKNKLRNNKTEDKGRMQKVEEVCIQFNTN